MSAESSPISSAAASELVVAHTTPTKSQRRRSNATASETRHVLKSSPGKVTTVRLPSPSAVKVSITGPRPGDNDSDDNTQDVADDAQITVSDIQPAEDLSVPSDKITIVVLEGVDIDPKGARLTYLCAMSQDEVTVPIEKKAVPVSQPVLNRPSRVPERSILPLPALCDGPPTPLEPVFKRSSPPPLKVYRREAEEAYVSNRRDSLASETSSTGYDTDYERDGEGDDLEQEVQDNYDVLPASLSEGRAVRSDSLYDDDAREDYLERPSNPVADAYSSDEDDEFGDLDDIVPVPYLASQVASGSDSDSDDEFVPALSYTGGLPLSRGPSRASRPEAGAEKVMQSVRGTKRRRSESPSPERDAVSDVDESTHVAKKARAYVY